MLVSIMYVFLNNSSPKPRMDMDFSSRILPTTDWVKDDLTVYFISGPELVSVHPNGTSRKVIFKANDNIRSYQFSPDGKDILIVSESQLCIYHSESNSRELVESLDFLKGSDGGLKGSIGGVRFSPDGRRFCYRSAKWSPYASQESWYVYEMAKKEKRPIVSPGMSLAFLWWDKKGENLYYPWFQTMDSDSANPYMVKLYKIPLTTLTPELAMEFGFNQPDFTPDHLATRGIDLDFTADRLSFGRDARPEYSSRSRKGASIAIDKEDMLYYVPSRWWRLRLYEIPRVPPDSQVERYEYQGGQLAVQHLRWFPSGRYVMMEHHFFGILVLDPQTGKIGILDNQRGNTFGWYTKA
jgi:hypothetical protein